MATLESRAKGLLIRRALSKAKAAQAQGFYLEVIALTDSIITECIFRIQFYSLGSSKRIRGLKAGVQQVIQAGTSLIDDALAPETRDWGSMRNSAIHGFTKLDEYDGLDWESRSILLGEQSRIGLKLAQRWLKEAARHKI